MAAVFQRIQAIQSQSEQAITDKCFKLLDQQGREIANDISDLDKRVKELSEQKANETQEDQRSLRSTHNPSTTKRNRSASPDMTVLTTVISPQLKRQLDQKVEMKDFENFKKQILSDIFKMNDTQRTRKGAKSPDLCQSFYSGLNVNQSDMMEFFTERKMHNGSSIAINRSKSRDNNAVKNMENRLSLKIDTLNDKH